MKKYLLLIFFVCSFTWAQQVNLDSLWTVYNNTFQSDTNRMKAIDDIAWHYVNYNPDSAIILAEQEVQLAKKTGQKKYEGKALNTMGASYSSKSDFQKSLEYYFKVLRIGEELGSKRGIASCYGNIGLIYYNQSDYPKALEYFLKDLKICEELEDKSGMAACYNNIGLVYKVLFDYSKALEYYFKGLKIYEKNGDRHGVGLLSVNIGGLYQLRSDSQKALEYFKKALNAFEETKDKNKMGDCFVGIGVVYEHKADYQKALENYTKALKIKKEIGDKQGVMLCYINIGGLYGNLSNYKLAIQYNDSALLINKKIGDINQERTAYQNLSAAYAKAERYKEAYENYVKFKQLTDSIFNKDKNKQLGDLKTSFEVQKKETELKVKAEAEQVIFNEEKKVQRFIIYGVAIVLLIVLIFSVFIFNRFKITQKQKVVIEKQKHLVEEKQKEIIDSITYAKRIQDAMLKEQEQVSNHLPEHFVLFKPKDIVSGDFYWALEKQNHWYVAAADCTGHGVPGAFLTMLGTSFLNEINSTQELLSPAEILNQLRAHFMKELGQTGKAGESKDGMDISLIQLNLQTNQLQWAGANNPLYIISNNELKETKPDKQPIGYADNIKSFTNNTFQLNKTDTVIIFSDGFADQFGGPKGKKFMYKQFKENLVTISTFNLAEQKQKLNEIFENWKGEQQQIDDVCVIGVRV